MNYTPRLTPSFSFSTLFVPCSPNLLQRFNSLNSYDSEDFDDSGLFTSPVTKGLRLSATPSRRQSSSREQMAQRSASLASRHDDMYNAKYVDQFEPSISPSKLVRQLSTENKQRRGLSRSQMAPRTTGTCGFLGHEPLLPRGYRHMVSNGRSLSVIRP